MMILLLLLSLTPIAIATRSFKIEVLHKPENCERSSKYGDQMFVHFVGTKLETGEEFDRRYCLCKKFSAWYLSKGIKK